MSWFRLNADILNDREIQSMSGMVFKKNLMRAMRGEQTAFSKFLMVYNGRPIARIWAEIRTKIFARDNFTCHYCGQRGHRLECDHVVPVSRGGSSDESNLVTACFPCNRSKRDRLVTEWKRG